MRDKLIVEGIKRLKEFGYSDVNEDNIFSDFIYSRFFKSMIKENKGQGYEMDGVIDELINEIKNKH